MSEKLRELADARQRIMTLERNTRDLEQSKLDAGLEVTRVCIEHDERHGIV